MEEWKVSWVPPVHKVPRDPDDDHYILSFTLDQPAQYIEFFNEFGFVVVRDVLTSSECGATIDDIWNYLEERKWTHSVLSEKKIKREDFTTWQNRYWPEMHEEGILGVPPVFTHLALKNRQNENVYKVFATLFGRKDLLVNHDRYGLFRPTIFDTQDKQVTRNDFKTFENVHIDMNPWMHLEDTSEHSEKILSKLAYSRTSDFIAENNEVGSQLDNQLHLQGLINLADNCEEDGGFHIVPGFKHHLAEWTTRNSHFKKRYGKLNTFIVLPDLDPICRQAVRVTARAGSLIVWDQRTLHGSAPNNSKRARYAQFIKYFPATPIHEGRRDLRKASLAEKLEENNFTATTGLTELGSKLFGQTNWDV